MIVCSVETCTSTHIAIFEQVKRRNTPKRVLGPAVATQSPPLQQSPRAPTSIRTTSTSLQCSRNSKIKQSLSHPTTPPTDFVAQKATTVFNFIEGQAPLPHVHVMFQ
uniref:Uncharacterized protein n=1 Tax=Caenorhabditis japonica TaxID=281687 RepID=A0A8R1I1U7_CAEJA